MSAAFTLVELVLAVLLGAMIMLSFAAIYANSYGWFRTTVQGNMRQAGAVAALQAISRDAEKTTYIARPGAPCPPGGCGPQTLGDELEGCTNFDPQSTANGQELYNQAAMRIYDYCVDTSNASNWVLNYAWIDFPSLTAGPCNPPPVVTCGQPPAGWTQIQLAQFVARSPYRSADCSPDPNQRFFCRPAPFNNLVELNFVIAGSTVSTRVGTSMSTLNPNQ